MVLQPPPPSTASPAAAQLFPPALSPHLEQAVGITLSLSTSVFTVPGTDSAH